jgi:DNA-binding MarR family transcriptional regulator
MRQETETPGTEIITAFEDRMSTRHNNLAEKVGHEASKSKKPEVRQPEATVAPFQSSATHLLHRAEQYAADIFARIAPQGLLTPRQYAILAAIDEHEGISQTGLVEKTGIDRSTLADIVRRMIDKGLVQRQRTTEDARAYAVRLTRKGSNMLRKMRPYAEEVDRQILQTLPEEYRNLFLTILNDMVQEMATSDEQQQQQTK